MYLNCDEHKVGFDRWLNFTQFLGYSGISFVNFRGEMRVLWDWNVVYALLVWKFYYFIALMRLKYFGLGEPNCQSVFQKTPELKTKPNTGFSIKTKSENRPNQLELPLTCSNHHTLFKTENKRITSTNIVINCSLEPGLSTPLCLSSLSNCPPSQAGIGQWCPVLSISEFRHHYLT